MRDTVILYDILVTGIELPAAIVGAINRKTEQYYIAEEYKFRIEREKRESERKRIEAEGIRDFQQIVSQGISESLSALARHRGNASIVAIDEFEDRRHRQRQGRAAGHFWQCRAASAAPRGEHAERERRSQGKNHGREPHGAVGENTGSGIGMADRKDTSC